MAHDFKMGDHVEWNSEAGRVRGTIQKKHSSPIIFKGYTVHASREEPQDLINPAAFPGGESLPAMDGLAASAAHQRNARVATNALQFQGTSVITDPMIIGDLRLK